MSFPPKKKHAASLKHSKHGLGTPKRALKKNVSFFNKEEAPAASLKRSKHGLGLPRLTKYVRILINIALLSIIIIIIIK